MSTRKRCFFVRSNAMRSCTTISCISTRNTAYNSSESAIGALEPGFMSFTPIPMSSTGAGANFNWLPFTLMSLTEWERPWVTKGLVVWLVVLFKLELVIEFVLGLEAEFELGLQFAVVVVELELELELLSCVGFGLAIWRFGLGMDFDLDFILEFAHDVELRVMVWSVSRLVGSDVESGDTDILAGVVDFDDPASVASWLADWDRIAWPPSLSLNAIW